MRKPLAALMLLAATCTGSVKAECQAFLDQRNDRFRVVVRQRIPVEIDGYVRTGDPNMDRDVTMQWSVEPSTSGAKIVPDPQRTGRAFFYPGFRQGEYTITLTAIRDGDRVVDCTPAMLKVDVGTDYTQFVQASDGSEFGGRIVAEFPLLTVPSYISAGISRGSYWYAGPTSDTDYRIGLRTLDPRLYVSTGFRLRTIGTNASPNHGFGIGVERLPDADRIFSTPWSIWYYPSLNGAFTRYSLLEYEIGQSATLPGSRVFLEILFKVDQQIPRGPGVRQSFFAPYGAIGFRL